MACTLTPRSTSILALTCLMAGCAAVPGAGPTVPSIGPCPSVCPVPRHPTSESSARWALHHSDRLDLKMGKDKFPFSLFSGCVFGVLLPLFFNAIGDAVYNKYYIFSVIAVGVATALGGVVFIAAINLFDREKRRLGFQPMALGCLSRLALEDRRFKPAFLMLSSVVWVIRILCFSIGYIFFLSLVNLIFRGGGSV